MLDPGTLAIVWAAASVVVLIATLVIVLLTGRRSRCPDRASGRVPVQRQAACPAGHLRDRQAQHAERAG